MDNIYQDYQNSKRQYHNAKQILLSELEKYQTRAPKSLTNSDICYLVKILAEVYEEENGRCYGGADPYQCHFVDHPRFENAVWDIDILNTTFDKESAGKQYDFLTKSEYKFEIDCPYCQDKYVGTYPNNNAPCCRDCFIDLMISSNP